VSLGPAEILVILVIALLVFGPNRLPEVGRQVGRTMREFRRFQQVMKRDIDEVFRDDEVTDVSHAAAPPPTLPPKVEDGPASGADADGDGREGGDGDEAGDARVSEAEQPERGGRSDG